MIFISYRRSDSAIFTGRLYDRLSIAYGTKGIFLDIHSIHVGDFTRIIAEHVNKSRVLLVVIGAKWLGQLREAEQAVGQPDFLRLVDVSQTEVEFCMLANTLGFYRDHVTTFEQLAARGVKLRFITSAFQEEDRVHWEAFARLAGERNLDETVAQAKAIRCMIFDLKAKFPRQVELRLNRKPIFYTMWLRDPSSSAGIGHLGVHYYADKSRWPSFRVSQDTGREMLPLLAEQFDVGWESSDVADSLECAEE